MSNIAGAPCAALSPARLRGMRRGIEKESLRAQPDGTLALTPHPAALGSALTHPHITTDFSESQLELDHRRARRASRPAWTSSTQIHQFTYRALTRSATSCCGSSSMPCGLPADETIPIGRYGTSNVGRAKSVYRMGLGHRYGRRMQTISGIHYNWSLPGVSSEAVLRADPQLPAPCLPAAVPVRRLAGAVLELRRRPAHELQPLGEGTLHMPHGTSLRMGRLGYQSDAQASLAVSYNSLDGYGASLQDALTRPYPAYEAIGIRNPGGEYNQLATSLLQIENEFYGTIRPEARDPPRRAAAACAARARRRVRRGALHGPRSLRAGRHRRASTMRFLDVFLLHCLLADSPPDTPRRDRRAGAQPAPHGRARARAGPAPASAAAARWRSPTGARELLARVRADRRRARCGARRQPACRRGARGRGRAARPADRCPRRGCSRPWRRSTTTPSSPSCGRSPSRRAMPCWRCRWPPSMTRRISSSMTQRLDRGAEARSRRATPCPSRSTAQQYVSPARLGLHRRPAARLTSRQPRAACLPAEAGRTGRERSFSLSH